MSKAATRSRHVRRWRGAAFSAAIVAGVIVAGVTTRGAVNIPPSVVWLAVAAVAMCFALLASESRYRVVSLLAVALTGIAAGHVLFRPGVPWVHDIDHFAGIWAYGRAVHAGTLFPSWIPWLGFGMPLLQFYGPLNFLGALPGVLLGLGPIDAWKLEVILSHALAALTTFASARLIGAGWRGSLVAGAAAAFAPWRLCNAHYRGALAESNAFVLVPLVAGATLRQLCRPSFGVAALLTASLSALVLTHSLSVVTLAMTAIPAATLFLSRSQSSSPLGARVAGAAVPWALAMVLTAAWWLPALAESGETALAKRTSAGGYFDYRRHGIDLLAPLSRSLWDKGRSSLPETASRPARDPEEMPFYAGAVLLFGGLSPLVLGGRKKARGLAASALLGLVLATPTGAGLAAALPGIRTLQFPWRFLSPATVFACLALGLAISPRSVPMRPAWRRSWPGAVLVLLIIWDAAPYTGAAGFVPGYQGMVHLWATGQTSPRGLPTVTPVPLDWRGKEGVVRVAYLALPPSDYVTPVDMVLPHYPEWLSRRLYRTYHGATDLKSAVRGGIRYLFFEGARDPTPVAADPYAYVDTAEGARIEAAFERHPGRIEVDASVPAGGGMLHVLEQAFPGWAVTIDGGVTRPANSTRGFLSAPLDAGRHHVAFVYGMGTMPRRAGSGVTLAGVAATLLLLHRRWRHWRVPTGA